MEISISILGSGNVATHLCNYFHEKGIKIDVIYNHDLGTAKLLANKINCHYTSLVQEIPKSSTIYLIALPNQHIIDTIEKLKLDNPFLVHTSGSFNSELLNKYTNNWGCLYPMQTFVKNQPSDLKTSPFFLEANETKNNKMEGNSTMEFTGKLKGT